MPDSESDTGVELDVPGDDASQLTGSATPPGWLVARVEAMTTITRDLVATLLADDELDEMWGDEFPELGQNDWATIVENVREVGRRFAQDPSRVEAAYTLLASYAEGQEGARS